MKLSIVIPCYNEEKTINELVDLVEKVDGIEKEIVIVDDGSKDGSRQILAKMAQEKPYLKIILNQKNSGKGATVRECYKHTTGDYVIVQDADLEYDPQDYKKLVTEIERGAQVVYGSRFSGDYKDMTSLHYFGNQLLTIITNILYGTHLTDMETCYKLLPGNFVRSLTLKSNRFDFEPEITSKILKSDLKIVEVPISYKGRSWKEGKKITWRDGLHAVRTLIKFRFFN
ncbi:glycosyl transferase [candidate division WWE3 bacterium CG08_land_8_20_14_0_20_41_10]|uniref:Glycosyl transferase n=1 Tax=candidate division WWE3 bacterium CG08_land_8_20_14_0_20_41_10 TaxID=1975085 RepID=A0A2H0XBW7_UNCKA|nr:MAG: glycosyl transferase [candidate division WWE3 bacterium CG08_land_8_20_14_0_20_41_10]